MEEEGESAPHTAPHPISMFLIIIINKMEGTSLVASEGGKVRGNGWEGKRGIGKDFLFGWRWM